MFDSSPSNRQSGESLSTYIQVLKKSFQKQTARIPEQSLETSRHGVKSIFTNSKASWLKSRYCSLCLFSVRLNFEKLYPGSRGVSRELNWTLCCLHFGCRGDSYAPPVHLLISPDLRGGKATSHSPLSGAEGNRREPKPGGEAGLIAPFVTILRQDEIRM